MKHTEGEWSVDGHNLRSVICKVGDKKYKTICTSKIEGQNVDSIEEEKANAKLIAAAPDMLEALIAISTNKHGDLGDLIYKVRDSEGEGWEGKSVKEWSAAIDKIRNAINKATA